MTLLDRIKVRRGGIATAAAVVCTALAVTSAVPAWGQAMLGNAGNGFLLDNGVFTTIDHPDAGPETAAVGINNRGQIVGGYVDAGGIAHGFLLDKKGDFTTINAPGALVTGAFGINNRGQVVGYYADANLVRGFLWDNGTFTTIEAPDALSNTAAFGINERGQIVGFDENTSGTQ